MHVLGTGYGKGVYTVHIVCAQSVHCHLGAADAGMLFIGIGGLSSDFVAHQCIYCAHTYKPFLHS